MINVPGPYGDFRAPVFPVSPLPRYWAPPRKAEYYDVYPRSDVFLKVVEQARLLHKVTREYGVANSPGELCILLSSEHWDEFRRSPEWCRFPGPSWADSFPPTESATVYGISVRPR